MLFNILPCKKITLLICIVLTGANVFATTGDTTIIIAHTGTNLNSPPQNDDAWVVFPSGKNWQQIGMKFTLGCGIPNCSGWDYTVSTYIGKKTGFLDSTVAAIDTLTNDTTWNYFEQVEYIEVGRLITPYGTYMANNTQGFDNTWTHPLSFDVSDYAPLLQDSVSVRVRYDGWTDAFSANIEFMLIEGAPTRTVASVSEIYDMGVGYGSSAGFESAVSAKSFIISPVVTSAKMVVIMTGHGSQGEFDPHSFHLKVNGNVVYSKLLWKDDCGMNAVAPQGGTWIFNRANWCPGEEVPVYEIDITPYITPGQIVSIDLDFDDYVIQSGQSASYGLSAHLITYTDERNHDVMLEEIIAPNAEKPYLRYNPICTNPIVKIKNAGNEPLTYAEISYWVKGGSKWYYEWTGNLRPYESEIIKLPPFDWNSDDTTNTFIAEANWPNNRHDEYTNNNHRESQYTATPVLDSVFFIQLRTNNHPEENWYILKNEAGDTIVHKADLAATTTYRDTVNLPAGSYVLDLYDYDEQWEGGDGLSWWLNSQEGWETSGNFSFRRSTSSAIKTFNPDFGNNIHFEFTVGYPLGDNPAKLAPEPPVHPTAITEVQVAVNMRVFPNPATDLLNIEIDLSEPVKGKIILTDLSGKVFQQFESNALRGSFTLSTAGLARGMYFLSFVSEGVRVDRKVILQ